MKTINSIILLIVLVIIGIFLYYDYQHQQLHNHRPDWVSYLLIGSFVMGVILAITNNLKGKR